MGLLYQFPTAHDENDDRIAIDGDIITLKSYGLPMVFWGYLAGIMFMLIIMYLAIKGPISSILNGSDQLNKIIALAVIALFILIPLTLLVLLFYEKIIVKHQNSFKITHRVFWTPIYIQKLDVKELVIEDMEGTPNIAKMENRPELKGFQNRGYFNLFAIDKNNKRILIDRSSQKNIINKLAELLKVD